MSLQETRDHLIQLLTDDENKVVALSGKWGTGKSHLWREVRKTSADMKIKNALYVSLFGLSDMAQIKLKMVQSALPYAEKNSTTWQNVAGVLKAARTALGAVNKGFTALDDLAMLAVPSILKDKVIVLDDIERKHEKLSIDEILGFIDEYTMQYGARFVLVLNSDQLAKREMWDTLREKVVDQEIRLDTSPAEAFRIAISLSPSRYAKLILKSVDTCGLTNIRIIRKVIRSVNRILGDRENLTDAVLLRVIPSIVVLAAINYKGLEDGPDFQFVLSVGSPSNWDYYLEDENKELDEEGKRQSKWKLMLNELGILACDEFEALVVEFLESGLFDLGNLTKVIDRYVLEGDEMEAREKARQFRYRFFWDHRLGEAELMDQAKELIPVAHLLDPYIATDLDSDLAELPSGSEIGLAIVRGWLDGFRAKKLDVINDDNPFNRALHHEICAEFAAIKGRAQAKTTVFDACMHIAKNSGWGTMQVIAMKAATPEDYEAAIRTMGIDDLRVFMRQMIEMRTQRQAFDPTFGLASERFAEACRNIVLDPKAGRLGALIKRLFENAKLGDQVAATVGAAAKPISVVHTPSL